MLRTRGRAFRSMQHPLWACEMLCSAPSLLPATCHLPPTSQILATRARILLSISISTLLLCCYSSLFLFTAPGSPMWSLRTRALLRLPWRSMSRCFAGDPSKSCPNAPISQVYRFPFTFPLPWPWPWPFHPHSQPLTPPPPPLTISNITSYSNIASSCCCCRRLSRDGRSRTWWARRLSWGSRRRGLPVPILLGHGARRTGLLRLRPPSVRCARLPRRSCPVLHLNLLPLSSFFSFFACISPLFSYIYVLLNTYPSFA